MPKYLHKDILVAMAMPEEGGEVLKNAGANVVFTGLGKVNATYILTKAIAEFKPKLVLNFGTAGSQYFAKGKVVAGTSFLQRDMDVSPLGFEKFATPFETVPKMLAGALLFPHLDSAMVGTGDSFETSFNREHGDLVDMEAYALAKVCFLENVPFAAVKYISDGADGEAVEDWQNSLKNLPNTFVELFLSLV